jgi:hypothetical protein
MTLPGRLRARAHGARPASLVAFALSALTLGACATARPDPLTWEQSSDHEQRAVTEGEDDSVLSPDDDGGLEAVAAELGSGERCESTARLLYEQQDHDAGWRMLMACARQGNLFQLRQVLSGPWPDEIKTRPDGALLVGMIIAARGGDLEHDLALLHRQRIGLFALADAVERPKAYTGRLLLVRARLRPDLRPLEDTTVLEEVVVVAKVRKRQGTFNTRRERVQTRRGQRTADTVWRQPVDFESEHIDEPTGYQVVARLGEEDPFLTGSRTQLYLVRFEGSRPLIIGGEVTDQAVGEVVAYFDARTRFLE